MPTSIPFRAAALLASALAAVLLAVLVALGQLEADAAPAPVIRVGGALDLKPVVGGFLGLSLEYSAVSAYAGDEILRPALVRLIDDLSPDHAPVLRIGGDSTDWSQVPVTGWRKPDGVRFLLTRHWLDTAVALASAAGAHVILGINLEDGRAQWARNEAESLLSAFGPATVQALEIGNEPELYGHIPWYVHDGVGVLGRSAGYDVPVYLSEFARFAAALPKVPLAGPSTGGVGWMARIAPFVRAAPRLKLVTVHLYPLQRCYTPQVSNVYPTIAHLLAPSSSIGLAARAAPDIAAARARGIPIRVDEFNSVSCRGKAGVSNTFASALWVLDSLFALVGEGVDGVNVHTLPGASYQPFQLTPPRAGPRQWRVNPMYYGMLAFADAVPAGSRLLSVSGVLQGLRVWAVRAPGALFRVVLINEQRASRTVSLELPHSAGPAAVSWLRGSSLTATKGITLAGQSFGNGTLTGLMAGEPRFDTVRPTEGFYTLRVPPGSAAILSLQSRG